MISQALISPKSIAVIGASSNESKPGGKVLRNLINGSFKGLIYAVNPKNVNIEGVIHCHSVDQIERVDLAIIAIPAAASIDAVKRLLIKKTRAFIVYSAGYSEADNEGRLIEQELVKLINDANATLIGPNCIGVIQKEYKGVFTTPIPEYSDSGCELISSSGATAVFIMEAAIQNGLKFSNVYSIGNAAQTGVEDILEYMDQSFVKGKSPDIKLLYLEQIKNPFKFLKHAVSLVNKGCRLAAIKAGYSEAGSRAASSHTGALATSDAVIRALFRKCGIVYCSSREELISVACVFQTKELQGNRIGIITHAGGSAVMLTDALISSGMQVPHIDEKKSKDLLACLNPGSSVGNPIDFLATGTAEQLGHIIDFCEDYEGIDAMIVVFGSPGLFNVRSVYEILLDKMNSCTKSIYAVLPSVMNAESEIKFFLAQGKVNFPDEVVLGEALGHVFNTDKPALDKVRLPEIDLVHIRSIINSSPNGYQNTDTVMELMQAIGITTAKEFICHDQNELEQALSQFEFPIVMKVIGPVHKTEVNGVFTDVKNLNEAISSYNTLISIPGANAVMIQEYISGEELYVGASRQGDFGHLIMCGLGGIFLELLKDTSSSLAPVSSSEAERMIRSLKAYPLIKGFRNRPGINEAKFIDIITRIAALVHIAPEISDLDLNPIKALGDKLIAVDVRIKIDANGK